VGVGVGAASAAAGAVAAAAVASSPDCSSLGFFLEAAAADDFSRGRRGARVGFSFSFSFSFSLSSFFLVRLSGVLVADVVVLLESSSFLRRDRLATEARRDPTISSTGPSSFDTPESLVDMVVKKEKLIYN
jgi:hypothetical protein